ncbi:MAG: hypothetical protein WAV90_23930 [Gordonia amarae]
MNAWTADGQIVGEVAPLIGDQLVLNMVNFDRLIVSRFGAFPQKVISGWSGSKSEVLAASAMRVWAFEDPEVKATALPSASTGDYNAVLEEIVQHIALRAGISLANVTGKLMNVSAEALAAAEANQQRKLAARRESFGESWEQVLRLAAAMDGDEMVWRDTEARAFAAVVDPRRVADRDIPGRLRIHLGSLGSATDRSPDPSLVCARCPVPPAERPDGGDAHRRGDRPRRRDLTIEQPRSKTPHPHPEGAGFRHERNQNDRHEPEAADGAVAEEFSPEDLAARDAWLAQRSRRGAARSCVPVRCSGAVRGSGSGGVAGGSARRAAFWPRCTAVGR